MTEHALESAARIAEPDEAVSIDELQLAARNHGLPLEALRYDVTPIGLHYLLDPLRHPGDRPGDLAAARRRARSSAPLSLDLDDLRSRPRRHRPR